VNGGSISFDRAAAYYDDTRGLTEEGVRRQTEILAAELRDRGRVLEVGVGTGQVALPLAEAGIPMFGLDLSRAMLDVLVGKGGRDGIRLVQGDATRMPFNDDAFGGVVLRWVLHLIPSWPRALGEIVRVCGPGGVALVQLGGQGGGPRAEIQERFARAAGISRRPVGVDWGADAELDATMRALGGRLRLLPPVEDVEWQSVETYVNDLEANRYSWTWPATDDMRRRAAAEVRAWAEATLGPLPLIRKERYQLFWRAYDLP
jgi:SAM-dependent methyltransferase